MSRTSLSRRWRRLPAAVRKPVAASVGFGLVTAGCLAVALPGPFTIPPILAGLTVLATEFVWARRLRDQVLTRGRTAVTAGRSVLGGQAAGRSDTDRQELQVGACRRKRSVMSKPLYRASDLFHAVRGLPGAFAAFGPGADVDAAFDDAVSAAGYDYGFADLLPSITAADAADLTVTGDVPLSGDAALAAALRQLRSSTPVAADVAATDAPTAEESGSPVFAWPVAATAGHSRRRIRVVIDDPDLELPSADTVLLDPPTPLLTALADAGAAPGDGETLERVEIKVRARFRPMVTVHRAATQSSFVVLDPVTNTLLSRGHRTAGVARRAAVAELKARSNTDLTTADLHVFKLAGRDGGLPLISVHRARLAQKVTAKVTYTTQKKPGATKVAGWLFAGILPGQ